MSGTLNRVLYALRPAKNVERKMLTEVFALLARLNSLDAYRYVGFGALGFHDHALVHRRLGVTDLVSIEANTQWKKRIDLNKPYKIHMHWGQAHTELPKLKWAKPSIVWLDYDDLLDAQMLDDVHFVASQAASGSLLVVTVCARPESVDPSANTHATRLAGLAKRVGDAKVPLGTTGKDLANWGLASVSRNIIDAEVTEALRQRSAQVSPALQVGYRQLFNFHYSDGAMMLSTGGLLATDDEWATFTAPGLTGLDFLRYDTAAFRIEVPRLTVRETQYLDSKLPEGRKGDLMRLRSLPAEQIDRYRQLYRYFPTFTEIDTSV